MYRYRYLCQFHINNYNPSFWLMQKATGATRVKMALLGILNAWFLSPSIRKKDINPIIFVDTY